MRRQPITPFGYRKLKAELREFKEVKRPANVRAIEEARAHGDLSENAEYKYAKEEQGKIAGRIQQLETQLALAQVIDPGTLSGERVVFGATVTLFDINSEEDVVYTIVGGAEADISKGRLSIDSPIARALIGREIGDEVSVQTPGGSRQFEVSDVEFSGCEDWD